MAAEAVSPERSGFSVVYAPTLPGAAPGDPKCTHRPEWNLSIGTRLVRNGVTSDYSFCLRCGAVHSCAVQLRDWFDALGPLWREFGWHKDIGPRLVDLVRPAVGQPAGGYPQGLGMQIALSGGNPHHYFARLLAERDADMRWADDGGAAGGEG